jgi:hypothetical protein
MDLDSFQLYSSKTSGRKGSSGFGGRKSRDTAGRWQLVTRAPLTPVSLQALVLTRLFLPAAAGDGGDKLAAWNKKNKAKINANAVKRANNNVPENGVLTEALSERGKVALTMIATPPALASEQPPAIVECFDPATNARYVSG